MRRGMLVVSGVLTLLAGALLPLAAQVVKEGAGGERGPRFLYSSAASNRPYQPLDVASVPSLRRKITLNLDGVSRRTALMEIVRAARLELVYSDSVVPANGRIRLIAQEITVAAALTEVLLDAGVDVVLEPNGRAALVERTGVKARMVGGIAGRVTEGNTNAPVPSVQVTIAGVGRSRYTDEKGQYRIPDVPVGEHEVTVRRVGFEAASRKVKVTEGETVVADFALQRVATALTQVVTTATGERSRFEVGNSIGTIQADSIVPNTLIRNMSDLLAARTPGVIVGATNGTVGAPSKIRIRGINSILLNNDPIIILDGVRLSWLATPSGTDQNGGLDVSFSFGSQTNTGQYNFGGGSQLPGPSRLDDIDPNTIESIDVLRGPSASSLYGTDAANGVIVIKTKKGAAGPFRFNLLADNGWSSYPGHFPDVWYGWGHTLTGAVTNTCSPLFTNTCIQDSVTHFQPVNNPEYSPLGMGSARNLSANLSGGTAQLKEFLALRVSNAVGILKLPNIEARRIERMWGEAAPSWMQRPNTEQDFDGSSRTNLQVAPNLDASLSVNGVYRSTGSARAGINTTYKGLWDTLQVLPAENARTRILGLAKRGFVSASSNFTPASWLSFRAAAGGDYTLRTNDALQRAQDCTVILATSTGCVSAHTNNRGEVFVTTMDVGGQLSVPLTSWVISRTAFGEQYSHTSFYNLTAANGSSTNLAFGTELLSPAPIATTGTPQLYAVTESRDESATAGYFVEQTFAMRERLFLTLAFRKDAASSFGINRNNELPTYPKFSMSWLLSDEPFFPWKDVLPSFRVRAAYGHSGNQTRQADVLPNYQTAVVFVDGAAVSGAALNQIPNPNLSPERSTEAEGGFDLSLFSGERLHLEATLYRKLSQDAISDFGLPPSYGPVLTTQRVNLGSIENRGVELSLSGKLIEHQQFGWDMTVNYTNNNNKVVSRSPALSTSVTLSQAFVPGYPMYGLWRSRPFSCYDRNGDGALQAGECAEPAGTATSPPGLVFVGPPYPQGEITYDNTFTLLSGALRVGMKVDQVVHKIGNYFSSGERCQVDRSCDLQRQALSYAALDGSFFIAAYTAPVSWVRLSELSVAYNVPRTLARRVLRAQSASVTLASRNLALWTNYGRKDPDVNGLNESGQAFDGNSTTYGGTTYGTPIDWTLRFNLGF